MQSTHAGLARLSLPPISVGRTAAVMPATIFLPKEHGSWSLALEPLALGLLLAPSAPGAALLAVFLAAFFARRPFKAAFAPRHAARRRENREAVVMFTALMVAGGFETLVLAKVSALWPLALTMPCGLLFAYFDGQGEGRAAAAELAGSAAFAFLPAVFATLAGWTAPAALALAALALVRSVPTVLTIRAFLRQRKGERVASLNPLLAALLGMAWILGLVACSQLPWFAAVGAGVLLLRTAWLTGPWRPMWSARNAGIFEAALGLGYLGIVATAFLTP